MKLLPTLVLAFVPAALIAQTTFTKLTGDPVMQAMSSTPAAFADFNADGWLDLYLGVFNGVGSAYTNTGNGSFIRMTNGALGTIGGANFGASWGDFDNDGWPDLLIGMNGGQNDVLLRNMAGTFARLTSQQFPALGGNANNVALADYDNDGFLDAFLANSDQNDFLLHNQGNGSFFRVVTNAVAMESGNSQGAAWGDYDDDGLIDLAVSRINVPTLLYRNLGGGAFEKMTNNIVGKNSSVSQGITWVDYDNDGRLDLFVSNPNRFNWLYHNDGGGQFSLITNGPMVADTATHMGCAWADYDNDGWVDLFVAVNGGQSQLYRNQSGNFSRITTGLPATDSGSAFAAAWGDINNDGFQDLVVTHYQNQTAFLYRNEGNSNRWITVSLEGRISNRSAIGAKVRAEATIRGQRLLQLRQISGGDGLGTQNDPRASFGLGDAERVEMLSIAWPSGLRQSLSDVKPNQVLHIVEPTLTISPRLVEATAGQNVTFVAEMNGGAEGFVQWLRNGEVLQGQTNFSLTISNVRPLDGGVYTVRITNEVTGMMIESSPAQLTGPILIVRQPQSVMLRPGSNAVFGAVISGAGPFDYQWFRNGAPLIGETNVSLNMTNVQLADEGIYALGVTNSFGSLMTSNATLVILIRPVITMQPVSQSVPAGGSATFSVSATGNPLPLSFRWRRGSTTLTNIVLYGTNSFFMVSDVQPTTTNQFYYNVAITNIAGSASLSSNAVLTILPDADGDGLADEWEVAYELIAANEDADGDGQSNLAEYLSGTNPNDPGDVLRLNCFRGALNFEARPAKTYSILTRATLNEPWRTFIDVPARAVRGQVELSVTPTTNAFFLLRSGWAMD